MNKLESITKWIDSNPSEFEVKRVENVIQKMIVSRTKRDNYEIERKYQKLLKIERSLKDISIPVPEDLKTSLKELKRRGEELKKSLPEVTKRVPKKGEVKE